MLLSRLHLTTLHMLYLGTRTASLLFCRFSSAAGTWRGCCGARRWLSHCGASPGAGQPPPLRLGKLSPLPRAPRQRPNPAPARTSDPDCGKWGPPPAPQSSASTCPRLSVAGGRLTQCCTGRGFPAAGAASSSGRCRRVLGQACLSAWFGSRLRRNRGGNVYLLRCFL